MARFNFLKSPFQTRKDFKELSGMEPLYSKGEKHAARKLFEIHKTIRGSIDR